MARQKAAVAAERYRGMSAAEFFSRYREVAGFSNEVRALYQTVRELVENALDATDAKGILPDIKISIIERTDLAERLQRDGKSRSRWFTVTVEDNGVGVPQPVIDDAFGRVLYSSKYEFVQTRGMYGLGVKAAVLYGQATAGEPAVVESAQEESAYSYMKKLMIDVKENKPRVLEAGQWRRRGRWHGTRVSITLKGDWGRARGRIIEYIKRTAIIAPYAEIVLETPEGEVYYFPRVTEKLPEPPKRAKPHPHGVDLEQMRMIIQSSAAETLEDLLVEEFQSVGRKTAQAFLEYAGLDPGMKPRELLRRRDALSRLVEAMHSFNGFRAPRSSNLSPIGEELIKLGLKRMYSPEWVDAVTRTPRAYKGHPFIVEVGIAWGGGVPLSGRDAPILLRYANKIPLLYEEREDVAWKVISSINWKYYEVELPAPIVVLVHIASTKVPYKGVGKESISDVPELEAEIRNAVQEVARRLRRYLVKKKREEEIKKKVVTIAKYLPDIARSLAILAKPPESWKPPTPEEERKFLDALTKLVARNLDIPTREGETPEDVVRRIIGEVKIE